MASAIIGGMIDDGHPARHHLSRHLAERYSWRWNMSASASIPTPDNVAAARADVVVLAAVKPQVMRDVCEGLRDSLQRHVRW
ncbi:hypothetical protein DSL92_00695 [Billgrantia gudaonensis]|uniref:Pyrroline-5-carboxylate reductase catalytic N-terminal domain-containing protein n=1 Tax=Billgrantia gudaonensis TaxID=376427 RepID=A0A3S0VT87_9GAMM|nr:hypothetical protein DSL92_00695 [Halomonas gudaonensis]